MRPPHQGLRRDASARQGELPRHRRRASGKPGHCRPARAGGGDPQSARGRARRPRGQGARRDARQAGGLAQAARQIVESSFLEIAMASVPQPTVGAARQELYRRHDHGNPGSEPVVWMDGLDIRIVQLFAAQFHEVYPEEVQPVSRSEGASLARYGNNLVPLAAAAPFGKTSPIFNYPYARSRDSLDKLAQDQGPDPCHGWKMQFMNPLTGGHAMPTVAAFIQLLPKGFRSQPYRSTARPVSTVVEGEGRVHVGDETFEYEARDTFVAPSWAPLRFEAKGETVLFSFSDRPGQEAR